MRVHDLPVLILHQVGAIAVQYARCTSCEGRSMLTAGNAVTARLHTVHGD